MTTTCSKCGAYNRVGARFCAACGTPLPTVPPSLPPILIPPPPVPPPTPSLPPLAPLQELRVDLLRSAFILEGKVTVVDQERQEKAPFDPARAMVVLSFVVIVSTLLLGLAAAGLVIGFALLILGVGIGLLGCLAPLILLPLKMILSPIIQFILGEPTATVLNFQVLDKATSKPVDVLLYRKPGGGNVRLGDVVQIHGVRKRKSNVIRAYHVQVLESGGHPTNYKIEALKPWPIWVGLLSLGATVIGVLQLTGVIHIW